MTLGIFEEIERLVEYIPIDSIALDGSIAKLQPGISLDSKFYFKDVDGVATRLGILTVGENKVSLRDIVNLLNKFLKDAIIEELLQSPIRYRQLNQNGIATPLKNLLFDFSLSALSGDVYHANLYLVHSLNILGIRKRLAVILSLLVNHVYSVNKDNKIQNNNDDRDVRSLFTLLALLSEPNNIDIYFDAGNGGFTPMYTTYLNEIQNLSKSKGIAVGVVNEQIAKSK